VPQASTQSYPDVASLSSSAWSCQGTPHDHGSAGQVVGQTGDNQPDFSFGNTVKSLGTDTVKWSLRVSQFGSHGFIGKGFFRVSEALTGWADPEHGYATLSGSLAKHFGLPPGCSLPLAELPDAMAVAVAQSETAGWFTAHGDAPWAGRIKRLDVTFDLNSPDRSAWLEAAWPHLRIARNEVAVRHGHPGIQTVTVHKRRPRTGVAGRVDHRVYDKDAEVGAPLEQLRMEVQLSAYRLEKSGFRDSSGEPMAAAGEAWSVLEKHGWWKGLSYA